MTRRSETDILLLRERGHPGTRDAQDPTRGAHERPVLPFGAQGGLTTRLPAGGAAVTPPVDSEELFEIHTEPRLGLKYIRCQGLTLVWAGDDQEFEKAVAFLDFFSRSPRDKGTIVLPKGAVLRSPLSVIQALTQAGIIVRAAEAQEPDRALLELAHSYVAERNASLENLNAFMSSGSRVSHSR